MRGDFETARVELEASLTIRRELGDVAGAAALLSNLGVIAEYETDYERSRELHEDGLALRIEAGDKGAIAISQMNLGNVLLLLGRHDEARACQEESLWLRRETGSPWAIALGEHNLGILTRSEGDYETTRELFAGALKTFHDHGDKWALAFMLEDVAVLAVLVDEPAVALRLGGAGAAVREETGSPRGASDQRSSTGSSRRHGRRSELGRTRSGRRGAWAGSTRRSPLRSGSANVGERHLVSKTLTCRPNGLRSRRESGSTERRRSRTYPAWGYQTSPGFEGLYGVIASRWEAHW